MSYVRWAGTGTAEALLALSTNVLNTLRTVRANLIRMNLNALAAQGRSSPLGGSKSQFELSATEIIVPESLDVEIDWRHVNGLTVRARVQVWTDAVTTGVTPRVKNITDSADYDGTISTTVAWTERVITIPAPGVAGVKRYRLYIVGSNATDLIGGIGAVEIFDPLF